MALLKLYRKLKDICSPFVLLPDNIALQLCYSYHNPCPDSWPSNILRISVDLSLLLIRHSCHSCSFLRICIPPSGSLGIKILVPLHRFKSCLPYRLLDTIGIEPEPGAGNRYNVLFDHDTAKIISAGMEA